MIKHISFPSIEQLRTVVHNIGNEAEFRGLDANNNPIYDRTGIKPTLKFKGTVKLHGTNAGVSYNSQDGFWYQSRENIITPLKDNAGFAFFASARESIFKQFIEQIEEENNISADDVTITIYGEWAGAGIQKGVGISNIEKSFFIFGVKISKPEDESFKSYWVNCENLRDPSVDKNAVEFLGYPYKDSPNRIYNINDFATYEIEIDFNNPDRVVNKLSELTIAVEDECPVSKALGHPETVGEGIVWVTSYNGNVHRFKVKGLKHANGSKVHTLKEVDDAKLNNIEKIINEVTPTWRLEQALEKTFDFMNGGKIDRKKLGDFIRNVIADVTKEDSDVISNAGLEPKDINKGISDVARKYFFAQESTL